MSMYCLELGCRANLYGKEKVDRGRKRFEGL